MPAWEPIFPETGQQPRRNTMLTLLAPLLQRLFSESRRGPTATSVPPALFGDVKAPFVRALTLAKRAGGFGFVQYSLAFEEPGVLNVSHYNVYSKQIANTNQQATFVASGQGSPIEFTMRADAAGNLAFSVQTVMRNGYTSAIDESPSVGDLTAAGEVPGAADSVTSTMIVSIVADKITTGTLSAVTIVSSTFALNLNDWTVTVNNNAAALGTVGFLLKKNSGGQNVVIGGYSPDAAAFISLYGDSAQTKLSGSLAQSVNGSDRSGTLRLADGSGTGALGSGQRIIATGSDGKIQCGTLEVDRANATVDMNFKNMSTASAGAVAGYIKIKVDGTDFRIPYHATV